METSKPIHELLYMSEAAYAEDYTERFMRWCINHAKDPIPVDSTDLLIMALPRPDLQSIMANTHISKWYNLEFGKLEQKFAQMVSPQHGQINFQAARQTYTSVTSDIFTKFPLPLLDAARQLKINANLN